jgi:hemerythrin-like metal-binding protein
MGIPVAVWKPAMSVGVAALDTDHRCLIRIINLLAEVEEQDLPRTVDIVLDTLDIYCRFHFAREERIIAHCGYPEAAVQRAEHREFTKGLRRLRDRFGGRGTAKAAALLRDQLIDWLNHHILIQDMAFKPFVVGRMLPADELRPLSARVTHAAQP